jgi:phosphoribosylaminoimidazole (AIR) synthetase
MKSTWPAHDPRRFKRYRGFRGFFERDTQEIRKPYFLRTDGVGTKLKTLF